MRSIFPQFPLLITHEFSHIPSSETDRPPVSKKQLHDTNERTAVCCALLGLSIKSIFIRAAARIQKRLLRKRMKTGGVYLGFHTLRGRKFPYGNFRTTLERPTVRSSWRRNRGFATGIKTDTADFRRNQRYCRVHPRDRTPQRSGWSPRRTGS